MFSTQLKKIQYLLLQYRDCFVMEGDQLGLCNHVVQVVKPKLHDLMSCVKQGNCVCSIPVMDWLHVIGEQPNFGGPLDESPLEEGSLRLPKTHKYWWQEGYKSDDNIGEFVREYGLRLQELKLIR